MNYRKIILILVILTILFFVSRYFYIKYKNKKEEEEAKKEQGNYNIKNGLHSDYTPPPPVLSLVGRKAKAKGNHVSVRYANDVTQIYKVFQSGQFIGIIQEDVKNGWIKLMSGEGVYVLALPSQIETYS